MLNQNDIKKFQEIYFAETKIKTTSEQAQEKGSRLILMVKALIKEIDKNKDKTTHGRTQ